MHKDVIAMILHQAYGLSMIIGLVFGIINIIVNNTKTPKYIVNFKVFVLLSSIFGAIAGLDNDNFYLGISVGIVSFLSLIISCYLVIFINGSIGYIKKTIL